MITFTFPSFNAGKTVLILGLGETGAAAARWCAQHGVALRVLDTRSEPAGLDALRIELKDAAVDYRLGPEFLTEDALDGVQSIVISPGLSPLDEPVKSFLKRAAQEGVEVIGDIELFARALA